MSVIPDLHAAQAAALLQQLGKPVFIGMDFGAGDYTAFGRVHADGRYEAIPPEEFYLDAGQPSFVDEESFIPIQYFERFAKAPTVGWRDAKPAAKPSYRHSWVRYSTKAKRRAANRAARQARRRNRA